MSDDISITERIRRLYVAIGAEGELDKQLAQHASREKIGDSAAARILAGVLPMNATLCQTHDEFEAAGPGAIWLWRFAEKIAAGGDEGRIMLKCPGCGEASSMHCRIAGALHPEGPSWVLTNVADGITMAPSINCVGCCGWHGWLKGGEFTL